MKVLMSVLFAVWMLQPMAVYAQADSFKVTTDRTVDNSSLESIIADVYRLSGAKTNNEKAIAIHDYLHRTIFHLAYPTEPKNKQGVGPLKVINTYGWGLCGGQHTVLKALFETAGWQVRYVGWPGHTTIEVNYDNRWHYFDTFLKCYFWTKDKSTIAGQGDIADDPSIALDGQKDGRVPADFLVCGDSVEGVVAGCQKRSANPPSKHEDGWASVTGRDHGYDTAVRLPSGATLSLLWSNEPEQFYFPAGNGKAPQHSCGTKDFRSSKTLGPIMEHYGPRNYSDGHLTYTPDFKKAGDLADIKLTGLTAAAGTLTGKGSAVFRLPSPFVYTSMKVTLTGGGALSVSVDGGKTFAPAKGEDVTELVKSYYDVALKVDVTAALEAIQVKAVVEHNRSAQPYLFNGKNVVTVSADDKNLLKTHDLTVSYSFQETTAKNSETRDSFRGNEVKYGEVKTVETKITALPFTFTVDVGGNAPPKMLALTRSVTAK